MHIVYHQNPFNSNPTWTNTKGVSNLAYCLMPSHYHLLVQTPEANLSRCMRHLNSVYTQRFNRNHRTDGALFRGRYKSILVEGNTYLLELVRYIHRNPLEAKMADRLDRYPWSSHLSDEDPEGGCIGSDRKRVPHEPVQLGEQRRPADECQDCSGS
ncbi:MAG: transposase [Desulfobacteraceae bacterium]